MNNEKLGAAPQMHVGGDAEQAIEFAWPYTCVVLLTLIVLTSSEWAMQKWATNDTKMIITPPIYLLVSVSAHFV